MTILQNAEKKRAWKAKRSSQPRRQLPQETIKMYEREFQMCVAKLGVALPCFQLTSRMDDDKELRLAEQTLRQFLNLPDDLEVPYDVERLPNARLRFGATPDPGMQIALASSETLSFCVVGEGPQGCNLQILHHLERGEWAQLLGGAQESTLAEILPHEESLDHAGSRILCAVQAARSAGIEASVKLCFERRDGERVLFSIRALGRTFKIVTFPVGGDKGHPVQMLGLLVDARAQPRAMEVGLPQAA
jgi:hypothetical protein